MPKKRNVFARASVLAMSLALSYSVASAQTATLDAAPAEDVVVVTGIKASAKSSVAIKKNTMEVVDSITAEDIGKLPDNNVSETLTRIPGVQGYRYAGEGASPAGAGSGVTIRGLSGQTASQVNSRVFFTAGTREFNVESAIPGMVAGVDVFKNPSAEHIEGGIGGLINIRTRNPSDFKKMTISLGTTLRYNDLANKSDPEVFGLFANRWNLPDGGKVGLLVAGVYAKSTGRSDNNPANGGANFKRAIRADSAEYLTTAGANHAYDGRTDTWFLTSVPTLATSATVGANTPNLTGLTQAQIDNVMVAPALTNNLFQETIMRTRKGLNVAADYRVNDTLRFYSEFNYMAYLYHQNYRGLAAVDGGTVQGLQATPFAYTEALANRNSNGGTNDTLVNKRLAGATYIGSTLNTVGGDEHQPYSTWTAAGGVEWTPVTNLDLKADLMYLKSDRTQDNRSVNMDSAPGLTWNVTRTTTDEPHTFAIAGPSLSDGASWMFRDYNNGTNQVWDDAGYALALSGKYHIENSWLTAIKFGVRKAHQQSNYNQYQFNGKLLTTNGLARDTVGFSNIILGSSSYRDLLEIAPQNFMRGKTGYSGGFLVFSPDALLGNNVRDRFTLAGIQSETSLTENIGNRRYVEEETLAGYVMGEFAFFNDRLRGNAGVRVIKTEGFARSGTSLEASSSYNNTLPSLNATYDLTGDNNLLLRFGYGKGLTRPGLDQLNPVLSFNQSTGQGSLGNPDLKPQVATSYDLSLEKYFSATNYVSGAVFRKDIDSFFFGIASCQTIPGAPAPSGVVTPTGCTTPQYLVTRTVNAEPGWVEGVEVAGQYFFDSLPGALKHFGVSGSYTYVDTALPVNLGTAIIPRFAVLPQPMQSKHNYSASGIYEDDKLSARIVYTFRSDAILFGASVNPIDGRYIKGYGILDASLNYELTDRMTVSFNALNITDQSLNRNVGEIGDYETDIERQHFLNGRNFNINLRYKIGG